MIGVLGGMGPAATVDFMAKVVRLTEAAREQDHVPMIVVSDPRVPDRVGPILEGRGESPLPAMRAGLRRLEQAGASCVAIPCHTAHFWYDELAAATVLPILHIADAAIEELARRDARDTPVGLLATAATLEAGFYQARLARAGRRCLEPEGAVTTRLVLPAIALVKRDRAAEAAPLLAEALERMREAGAGRVLLACTELPVALAALPSTPTGAVDATRALARAAVAWYRAHPHGPS